MTDYLGAPRPIIKGLNFYKFIFRELKTVPGDVLVARHPADGRFASSRTIPGPVSNPLEYAHVLAKARPQEIAALIFAKPIHVENARRYGERALHREPMAEVVTHVISAEGQHRHRIAAHFAHRTCCCCSCL